MYYYIIRNIKNKLVYVGYTNSPLEIRWSRHLTDKATMSRKIIGKFPNPTIQVLEESSDGGVKEKEWFDKVSEMGYELVNYRDNDKKIKKNKQKNIIKQKKYNKIDSELLHLKWYFRGIESKNY
tara:strand:+ start:1864 stop:2235 length:372 start_codon:yes stop_codon:yes gene_type:complete